MNINVNAEFTGFDYDDEKNYLRLTFDLKNEDTKKFIKSRMALGTLCNLEIMFEKLEAKR